MSHVDAAKELQRRRQSDAVKVIVEGVLVLATRDGLPVTEAQALDRARNIVMVLMAEGLLR